MIDRSNKKPEIPNFNKHDKDKEFKEYIDKILSDNLKKEGEVVSEVEYSPVPQPVSTEVVKNKVKKSYSLAKKSREILAVVLTGTIIIGSGFLIGKTVEKINDNKTRDYISVLLIKHTEGRKSLPHQPADYYDGSNYWYDENKMVDAIIEKGSYKDPEMLYLQFGRIYNGLKDEGNYGAQITIPDLYVKLRDKLLRVYDIEIGPETFEQWLESIGKYLYGTNNLELMYENYLDWFYSTREEVVNDSGSHEIVIGDKIFVINEDRQLTDCYQKIDYGIRL